MQDILHENAEPNGLTTQEAALRLARHGPNTVEVAKPVSPVRILIRQFRSPLVAILFVASALALSLGEVIDAAAILTIVVVNGVLGFLQEWRAERAIEALRGMLSPVAEVIRDGELKIVPAESLVPGDLVRVSEGQKVPADLELRLAAGLRLDESALTGESVPVDRDADGADSVIFMGTLVVGGRAEGTVVATGAGTEFGKIAQLTGAAEHKTTRLQAEMALLSRRLGFWGLAVASGVLVLGLVAGREFFAMLLTSVSMAVAVVPEGLPLVVTLTLAIGATAMVRQKALLRRLQAAETLGAASVICTDKTGTLTANQMTATRVVMAGSDYAVSGSGYDPAGRIEESGRRVVARDDPALARLLHAALVCNNARLDSRRGWAMTGDPTEGALLTLGYKGWAALPDPGERKAETPFSSERRRMGVLAQRPDGRLALHVKGAPEAVLPVCSGILLKNGSVAPLDDGHRDDLTRRYQEMASEGLRVIAIADRDADGSEDMAEEDLVLLGMVGLLDPPRAEVSSAVEMCRRAGVRVLMITGDSPATASAIARLVGIRHGKVLTGPELAALSEDDLADVLREDVLFARTAPAQKLRIVRQLQAAGAVVAMTGDGVNDAPALNAADVGMAMGLRGTDVAKEAADLVLLDDNFATIVQAIREGRRQFENIRKFVRYLLASNSAEVIALTVNLLIGGPLILLPVHILWINLLTDGVSAVALGLEESEPDQMERPPLSRDAHVLTVSGTVTLAAFGIYMAAACLAVFYWYLENGEALARTMAFTTLVISQELAVFAFRSQTRSAARLGLFGNPWLLAAVAAMLFLQALALYWPPLQLLLGTVPLSLRDLGIACAAALPVIFGPTLAKRFLSRNEQARNAT